MATKKENIEKLTALNVTLTGAESAKDLEALVKAHTPADTSKPAPSIEDAESVDVIKHTDDARHYIRTYSREIHGDNFLDLAKQLQVKYPSFQLAHPDSVPVVIVRYREKEDAEKPLDQQSADAPFVDKEKKFTDKDEALKFNILKHGTIVVAKS